MNRREFLAASTILGTSTTAAFAVTPQAEDRIGIWDNHCHISGMAGVTATERIDALLRIADRVGVERLCLHLGRHLGGENPPPEQFCSDNDFVLEAMRHAKNRVLGYVYLNPNYLDVSLKEFDRCVVNGPMVGIKLWVAKKCSAAELDPIVKRAAEQKAVIYQHTWLKVQGNQAGESTPMDVVELSRRHPGVKILCGHSGGDWERGIRMIRSSPDILLEIAGSDPTSGFVEMAVRELGAERVVFGSDVSGRSFSSQIAKVMGAEIPDAAKRLILRDNLRGLLLPALKARGYDG
jgi:uncharacterized protein